MTVLDHPTFAHPSTLGATAETLRTLLRVAQVAFVPLAVVLGWAGKVAKVVIAEVIYMSREDAYHGGIGTDDDYS